MVATTDAVTVHGRSLRFGISVTPAAADHGQIVAQVLAAERGGLDLVGIQDHPYQRRFLDTFALIADLLARTERLRFFPDVASLPMRPPPMLAKAAASLDTMSGGRFELGIGAGAFWDAVAGMGGVRRDTPAERIDALEEAIGIIRAALDVGPARRVVRGDGRHYPVPGYPAGPPPVHRVEIWVGAMAPRTLDLIGRMADGWIPGSGTQHLAAFAEINRRIDEAAEAAGRPPSAVRRIVNLMGNIADGQPSSERLVGPAEWWIQVLTGWALELGLDSLVFWPQDAGTEQVERFAADVVPGVREAVRRASASASASGSGRRT